MTATTPEPTEQELFQESEQSLKRFRAIAGLATGVILMPTGAGLDLLLYPDQIAVLTVIRMITTIGLAIGLVIFWRFPLGRLFVPLSMLFLLLPSFGLSLMIFVTDGGASPYFYGLILLMMISHLVGLSFPEAIVFCTATIAAYVAAVLLNPEFSDLRFLEGLFFLVLTGFVCVLVCYLNRRNRFTEFKLRRQLERQSTQRLEFLADVSHELRTPLSLIIAPLDEVLSERGAISESIGQNLSIMRRNVDRLRLLVEDLLDAVRKQDATLSLTMEDLDLREFVDQTVELTKSTANSHAIDLLVTGDTTPIIIHADPSRLERVLLNLLGNGFKFSPPESTIRIDVRREADRALLEVSDEGPGIPEEMLDQIFNRLYQADNLEVQQKSQGLGLGLAISNQIIHWHGGQITAENLPQRGARFRVWLPLVEPNLTNHDQTAASLSTIDDNESRQFHTPQAWKPTEMESTTRTDTPEPTGGRVLIIDDEPDLRNYLASSLEHSHEIQVAGTAEAGIAQARDFQPDCILLDLMLPDAYQFSALKALSEDPVLGDAKILMMTADIDESVKIASLQSGADDFLPKPFGISELQARVSVLVASSQLQRDLRSQRQQLQDSLENLRATELKLFQSEKMRAIAGLAGGLLHEINNPVNYSLMAIKTLQRKLPSDSPMRDTVDDIHEGVDRIGNIVSDLRAFAHPEHDQVTSNFPIREAICSARRFAQHDLQDVPVHIAEDPAVDEIVSGSQSQIVQVVLNLILNARNAIERRRLVPSEAPDVEPGIQVQTAVADQRLLITVTDTGIGMSPEDLARIREPFFTTGHDEGQDGAQNKGLGLGLSICESIIDSHGGSLVIESEMYVGTKITFDLPLQSSDSASIAIH